MSPIPVICIKYNNVATNDPCAICGERTDPAVGPELFLDGTASLVCRPCGQQYEPELVTTLDALAGDHPAGAMAGGFYDDDAPDWWPADPDGCTCGPQGPGHVYLNLDGTDVVHRPWCELHPDDCDRTDCCAPDIAASWDITGRSHLRVVTP